MSLQQFPAHRGMDYVARLSIPSGTTLYTFPSPMQPGLYQFDRDNSTSMIVEFITAAGVAATVTSNAVRQVFSIGANVTGVLFTISGSTTLDMCYSPANEVDIQTLVTPTEPSTYLTHFLTSTTWTVPATKWYSLNVVGGGAGGLRTVAEWLNNNWLASGGGGSGYFASGTFYLFSGATYSITVGAGGVPVPLSGPGLSSVGSLISANGGGWPGDRHRTGGNGGSGGGGGAGTYDNGGTGGANGNNGANGDYGGGTGQGPTNTRIPAGGGGANRVNSPIRVGGTYVGIGGYGAGAGGSGGTNSGATQGTNATGRGCGGGGVVAVSGDVGTNGTAGMVVIFQ